MDEEQRPADADTRRMPASGRITFFGSYTHSVDAKGRIIIPNAYRASLGESFTVGPARDFKGVALYPDTAFEEILTELSGMNQRKPFVQKYTTQFYKLSYRDMQPDGQGRLLLPPKLRQRMLGEAKDLEFSGAFNHVRIVDALLADADDLDFTENLDAILERIGDIDAT